MSIKHAASIETTAEATFQTECKIAFATMIRTARRLRPKLVAFDLDAAHEMGEVAGRAAAEAGMTGDEGARYLRRVLAMVAAEHQA